VWRIPPWVLAAEFGPLAVGLAWELRRQRTGRPGITPLEVSA
jgi:hypothetical protein